MSENLFNPILSLQERLLLGGEPDDELYHRANRCAEFFTEEPHDALLWKPKLKRAALSARSFWGGCDLWGIVEPILYGSAQRAPKPRPIEAARPAPSPAPATTQDKPKPSMDVDVKKELGRLSSAFEQWLNSLGIGTFNSVP